MARIGKTIGGLVFIWLVASAQQLFAGSLTGELDKVEGTVEDQFVYTLTVQGNAEGEPQFPTINDVEVQRAGTSQSVSIANGRMSREVQYQFILVAAKEANYAIPAIVVKIDGKLEQTLPLEFKVTAANQSGDHSDQPLFLERSFSKNKVYLGESILASVRLFRKVRVMSAEPDFWNYPNAFQVKKLEGQKTYRKTQGGQEYEVTELNSVLLPTKPGRFEIPPAALEARFATGQRRGGGMLDELLGSTQSTTKRFRSEPGQIEVLALPLAERRNDFSGLVGEFQGHADVSAREIPAGETVTITLTIEGKGSTAGMAEPELNLGNKAKVYKDKPQSNDNYDAAEGVLGRRIYKMAVVPTRAGDLDLGTLKLQYFNTSSGLYQDITIALGKLHVQASASGAKVNTSEPAAVPQPASEQPTATSEVKSLAHDLLEPHAADRLDRVDRLQTSDLVWAGCLLSLSLVGLGFGGWRAHVRRQGRTREVQKKSAKALQAAYRELKNVQDLLSQQELQSAAGLAQKVIRQYLGDRFDIKGSSLTLRDLEQHLQQRGLDTLTLQSMRGVWQNLDQLLFAPESANVEQGRAILKKVNELLQEVEQRCEH